MTRRLRSPAARATLAAVTAAFGALLLVSVAFAEAGDGISASGVRVDKWGWWHFYNAATAGPTGNVTVPPPPGVPPGTLAVGAVNGDADRIAAIGMLPDARPGDTIRSFTMTIKEAGPPAAGFNGSAAKIIACPITEFWVGGENGVWENRPKFDCSIASAEGTRALDGTWSFDLLPVGQAWVDPQGEIAADGVVLLEDVEEPEGFQTVFATDGDGAIVITLAYEPVGGASTTTTFEIASDTDGLGGGFDGSSDGFQLPPVGTDGGAAPVSTPTPGSTPQNAPPAAPRPIGLQSPNILGNLPGGLVLAVPLFLALLGLLAYSLGPAGEPAAATRQRGVSRALAARARLDQSSRPASSLETM